MKILMANKFLYPESGVTTLLFSWAKALEAQGHTVAFFGQKNVRNIPSSYADFWVSPVDLSTTQQTLWQKIRAAGRMIYSWEAKRKMEKMLDAFQPDVVHVANIYHHLSPSILGPIKKRGIPIVMSVQDYKLVCPNYTMINKGEVYTRTNGGHYFRCVSDACMNNSRVQSFWVALEMFLHHKIFRFYERLVDVFLCPSEFVRQSLVDAGYDPLKCFVLPNVVANPMNGESYAQRNGLLYVGRLSEEKGVLNLLEAWKGVRTQEALQIIGEGPQRKVIEQKIHEEKISNVVLSGWKSREDVLKAMQTTRALVVPSLFPEPFGIVVLEAFASGTPVVASNRGALPELVEDQKTGWIVDVANIGEFTRVLQEVVDSPEKITTFGKNALDAMSKWNFDQTIVTLLEIYQTAKTAEVSNYSQEPAGLRRIRYAVEQIEKVRKNRQCSDMRLLDVGAGMGNVSRPIARLGYPVVAVEQDFATFHEAKLRQPISGWTLHCSDISQWPKDDTYDAILLYDVLEHFKNPERVLSHLSPMLKNSGVLILSIPNGCRLEERIRKFLTHSPWGLRIKRLLKKRGILSVERVQSHAESPHEQFWSWKNLQELFSQEGWEIVNAQPTSAGFKEFYYLVARFILSRRSKIFHFLNAVDSQLAKRFPLPIADGWLLTVKKK